MMIVVMGIMMTVVMRIMMTVVMGIVMTVVVVMRAVMVVVTMVRISNNDWRLNILTLRIWLAVGLWRRRVVDWLAHVGIERSCHGKIFY